MLVDHARPERLGELVRTLYAVAPELEVHTEVHRLAELRPGSTLVLVPRVEDADWLNINRPLFASRALRVVLFCTREVSVALSRRAVDFFDWVSLRLECPTGPALFGVAGLRLALATRAPGVVWAGGDLEASFAAARPRRVLRRVSTARRYEELVAETETGRRDWLAWTDVEGEFRLRRVRWALAEARCRTRSILVEPSVPSPGWWKVHGRVADLFEARELLARAGADFPGRLAALTELEPEAIQLLSELLERGVGERILEEEVLKVADPGVGVGQLAIAHGLVAEKELARGRAPPPVMRALAADRRRMRLLHAAELDDVAQKLFSGEQVDADDAAWWSAWARTSSAWNESEDFGQRGESAERLLRSAPRTGETWERASSVALVAGDFDVANLWAQRAIKADSQRWTALYRVLREQARLDEAETFLRSRLATEEQMPETTRGWVLHELGSVLSNQGRYNDAEEMLRQSLSIDERTLGARHVSYGASLHELARVLERQGRYAEAETLLHQSLPIVEQAHGPRHPAYGALLHGLARVLEKQGRFAEAEPLARQVLSIVEQTLGPRHRDYGASLHLLARVLDRLGRYSEAEELLRQSLVNQEKALGPQHPDYGAVLHELARILEKQGQYAEAETMLRQALSVIEQGLGAHHPAYGTSLHQLASVLEEQGRYAEAEDLLRQSLSIAEQTLGLRHPSYGTSVHLLASVLDRQGRYAEAEALLRQALSIFEEALGPRHPELCPTLANLGFVLAKQGRPVEGEPFLLRSVNLASDIFGPYHPETAQALSLLALIQDALKKAEAPQTARQAMDSLLKSLGPDHPFTKAAVPTLNRILKGGG